MKSYKYAVKLKSRGETYTLFVFAACIGNAKCVARYKVDDDDAAVISVIPVATLVGLGVEKRFLEE
jgi:hypothetical protein